MTIYILIFWAVVAGAFLPLQAGINGRLAQTIESPVYAAFFSFGVGTLCLWAYALISREAHQLSQLKAVPLWVWSGGALGAFYVASVIALAPRLGAALTFGLVVAGQMGVALFLDHYALLGMPQQSISLVRMLGVCLITGGVVLIRI